MIVKFGGWIRPLCIYVTILYCIMYMYMSLCILYYVHVLVTILLYTVLLYMYMSLLYTVLCTCHYNTSCIMSLYYNMYTHP